MKTKLPRPSQADIDAIRQSGLFDEQWYLNQYPDVKAIGIDPVEHYAWLGAKLNRNPSLMFDGEAYVREHRDVAAANINPLIHFLRWGRAEGRTIYDSSSNPIKTLIREADSAAATNNWLDALNAWSAIYSLSASQPPLRGRAKLNISILQRLISIGDYVSSILSYRDSMKSANNKTAIFTAISGDYDSLKLPTPVDPRFSYYVFCDTDINICLPWQRKIIPRQHSDSTRAARYVKTHPHILPSEYSVAIWIDANIMITGDIYPLLTRFLQSDQEIGAVQHPERDNIYDEFQACRHAGKDDPDVMERQILRYRREGFQHSDLIESNILFYRLDKPRTHKFLDCWWNEILHFSKRDQLSINYSLKHAGIDWHRIAERPISARNHDCFAFGGHGRSDDGLSAHLVSEVRRHLTPTPARLESSRLKRTGPVVQVTPKQTSNAYYRIIPDAILALGFDVQFSVDLDKMIEAHGSQSGILHFHQLEPFYHRSNQNESWNAAFQIVEKLALLKERGFRLVHTWHNPLPHDDTYVEQDLWIHNQIGRLFDRVIIHLRTAYTYVSAFVPSDAIRYIPHPSFLGVYGPKADRTSARDRYGLGKASTVVLSFGEVKPYKGLDKLNQAWRTAVQNGRGRDATLFVAGRVHGRVPPAIFDERIDIVKRYGYVPDSEVPEIFAASDIAVFTHKRIWTSGAAILAMSYGLPVILPRSKYTEEYVVDGVNGFLYESLDQHEQSLDRVILRALSSPLLDHIRIANHQFSTKYSVAEIAPRVADLYNELRNAN